MPSREATRRASSTALSEQHPPCLADSFMSSRGHCCRVTPTTSWPCACRSAAATEESTPPDIATATLIGRKLPRRRNQALSTGLDHVTRHDLRILGSAVEDRRFRLAQEVDAHEVQAGHARPSVRLHRKAHVVEQWKLHPSIVRPVAARPDHRLDSIGGYVQLAPSLDPQRRGRLE